MRYSKTTNISKSYKRQEIEESHYHVRLEGIRYVEKDSAWGIISVRIEIEQARNIGGGRSKQKSKQKTEIIKDKLMSESLRETEYKQIFSDLENGNK